MKNQLLFIIVFILCSCYSKDSVDFIIVKNNTKNHIYYCISESFPDTLLPKTKEYLNCVKPNNEDKLGNSDDWVKDFSNVFPKDTLLIFFFNSDTINKYDWATIVKDYKVMERRTYSKSDLEESNWTITYP